MGQRFEVTGLGGWRGGGGNAGPVPYTCDTKASSGPLRKTEGRVPGCWDVMSCSV